MAEGQNLLVCRLSIFSGMVAAAVTLIYLTPVPDQSFKNCDRPCHELDWPMICRFKLVVEKLPTSVICQNCNNCSFCASPNDLPAQLITVNRQFPAPTLQVCHNDILIVDVVNKMPEESVSMHWRGQTNAETPFMDGVPLVTQCPIGAYSTFQYKFRASSAGTYSYHAFSDSKRSEGLFGALIVKKPPRLDDIFDIDHKEHILLISESKSSVLINGIGASGDNLSKFNVSKGIGNKFRCIYTSGSCPLTLSIENHLIKIISIDGNQVKPTTVSSINLTKGETVDFILNTNQESKSYNVIINTECKNLPKIEGKGVITYNNKEKDTKPTSLEPVVEDLHSGDCEAKKGDVCLDEIKNLHYIDDKLKTVDKRIYLGFDRISSKNDKFPTSTTYYRTNNISFIFPPSPVLTQPTDIPVDLMCNEAFVPDRCKNSERCECVHLEHIPLGSSTEIVLVDQGIKDDENDQDKDGYIFHLHGYHFYVVGSKVPEKPLQKEEVEKLDTNFDFIQRNLNNPLEKTTVRVPKNGMTAIRFLANNPGFWMLRDENAGGWTRGLDIVFQVGDTGDLVDTPTGFPTCGNFIGPAFFLF